MASSCRAGPPTLAGPRSPKLVTHTMTSDDTRFDYLFDLTGVPIVYLTGRPRAPAESGDKVLLGSTPVLMVEEYSPAPWIRYH